MGDPSRECQCAIRLAVDLLSDRGEDLDQYKLISVVNLIKGPDYAGPQKWRLSFKRRALIPQGDQAEVGSGGELFVEVDLTAQASQFRGYGE